MLLQDTIVRYSAAKYLARLSELLPPSMSSQIVEAVTALFQGSDINPVVMTDNGKILDPGGGTNGEARWHGVCLALAEMARRGLVDAQGLEGLLPWVIKVIAIDYTHPAQNVRHALICNHGFIHILSGIDFRHKKRSTLHRLERSGFCRLSNLGTRPSYIPFPNQTFCTRDSYHPDIRRVFRSRSGNTESCKCCVSGTCRENGIVPEWDRCIGKDRLLFG